VEKENLLGEEVTRDVCEVDFPPETYGESPEEIEATIQEVVERIFRDEDGAIRSGVYGRTMKPLTPDDVKDRPYGIGTYAENANMPGHYKPVWLNYENMIQASGKYLGAMTDKYGMSGDPLALERARRTFEALKTLWDNVAEQNSYGRGWMPKPYAGIHDVGLMTGSSVDQYTDLTVGLETFYRGPATCTEKTIIEDMIISFADWMIEYNYTFEHMGNMCRWHIGNPPLSTAYFLYLHTLAHSFSPRRKYAEGFDHWLEMNRLLFGPKRCGLNTTGLVLKCMLRLLELRPEYCHLWRRAAAVSAEYSVGRIDATEDHFVKVSGSVQEKHNGAYFMCVAHKLLPEMGYDDKARECLKAYRRRADFYHLSRGQRVHGLSPIIAGDDYRNTFWAEGHINWLHAYWTLKGLA